MASQSRAGILPLYYQRSVNGQFTGPSRSILRLREKYVLLSVIAIFVVFSLIGVYFLPELKTSSVYKLIKPSDQLGPNLIGIIPPVADVSDVNVHTARYKADDVKRLNAKIKMEMNYSMSQMGAVLPRPNIAPHNGRNNANGGVKGYNNNGFGSVSKGPNDWTPLVLPDGEDPDPEMRERRNFVKKMVRHAWDNYVTYAWGENELRPISMKGHSAGIFGNSKLGATIVDGLDTLYIMGMTEEYKKGRDWVEQNLSLDDVNTEMSVFETTIRFVGGLLTCYAFTKDPMLLEKAHSIASKLLPAFNTPTGIPHALINPVTGGSKNYAWASQSSAILAEIGTIHMEFVYLSDLIGDKQYSDKVFNIRHILNSLSKPHGGLYPNYVNTKTGKFGQQQISVGALGDSFYEYLLKSWYQSGGKDTEARRMYDDAVKAIESNLVQRSSSGLIYLAEMKYDRLEHKMDHLACFSGGMFAYGGQSLDGNGKKHYTDLGAQITNTCHESYRRTATQLGPESFRFSENVEAKAVRQNEKYYILRPEVLESYFYMWRLTHDRKYRDWAWEAVLALEKYCRTDHGYSGIRNVYDPNSPKDDVQQSFIFAETFKYLYLIFSTDDLISFDDWVFNTEAHPLPIRGKNPAYPDINKKITQK